MTLHDQLTRWSRFDLVATLTLLLLLLYSGGPAELRVLVLLFGTAGLLLRSVRHRPEFWTALAGALGAFYVLYLPDSDNHKFLIAYWCLALGMVRLAPDPEEALRTNARLLVGLAFGLAALWKLLSPAFLSGDFFHFYLLTNVRLSTVAQFFGGMEPGAFYHNRQAIDALKAYNSTLHEVRLLGPGRLRFLADLLTWWTLTIEALVATVFLWPSDRGPGRWRDGVLLIFVLTTYAIMYVPGFAWLLIILGLAQMRPSLKHGRMLYFLALGGVIFYRLDPLTKLYSWISGLG